ncbi:MAG: ABC transporter ATP-binding protein [Thermoplasmatota archaeon]
MKGHLVLKGVSKSFGKEKVLNDLDLSVKEGTIAALLGPSGCGKSTILKIIAGLTKQDRGKVMLNGRNINNLPASRRGIGLVFQNYSLFPKMNVYRNIEFGLKIRKVNKAERKKRCKGILELVGLCGLEDKYPSHLSGGQQQRVALARVLVVDPQVLLLDEPFAALDASIRKKLRRDLLELQERLGFTSIFVTHDQEEAFEIGHHISVMNQGRIEQTGRPRDLYDCPGSPFIARFVGNVNTIMLDIGEGCGKRWVMVRPEDVRIERLSEKMVSKGVKGKLLNYTFFGPFIEAVVMLENGNTLRVLLSKGEFVRKDLRRGDEVKVKILHYRSFPY